MVAVVLLLSTITALCAPAAVAISKDEITTAATSDQLSPKVKSFFSDVLEDAMTRSGAVAQINPSFQSRVTSNGSFEYKFSDFKVESPWKSLFQMETTPFYAQNVVHPVLDLNSFDIQSQGP